MGETKIPELEELRVAADNLKSLEAAEEKANQRKVDNEIGIEVQGVVQLKQEEEGLEFPMEEEEGEETEGERERKSNRMPSVTSVKRHSTPGATSMCTLRGCTAIIDERLTMGAAETNKLESQGRKLVG